MNYIIKIYFQKGDFMKKTILFFVIISILCSLTGCNTFKDTPETDAAFAAYEDAVLQTIAHKKGAITVATETKSTVGEETNTLGVIEYNFTTDEENRVSFERNDYANSELVASYYGDGKAAFQMDFSSGEWLDVTEDSANMLEHDKNYFNTLSLFRIDNQFRYSKHFLESVVLEEAAGEKVIKFTLKNSAVTDMLDFTDKKGVHREMASQTREYYVNQEGDIQRIVINTMQEVLYEGKQGTLSSVLTITTDYE